MFNKNGITNSLSVNRSLVVIGFLLVVLLVVVGKLILPGINQVKTLSKELDAKKDQRAKIEAKLNELEKTDYGEVSTITNQLLTALPITNNYLMIHQGVVNLANNSNVAVTDFQINPGIISGLEKAESKNGYDTIGLDLTISGDLISIKNMVSGIENSLPVVTISKLLFNNTTVASSSAITQLLESKISLVSYWQRLPDYLARYEEPIERLNLEDYGVYEKIKTYQPLPNNTITVESPGQNIPVGRDNPFPI